MKKPSRSQVAIAVWFALFAGGVALLMMDIWLIGLQNAIVRALNDPAKMYFHIVLLPLAAFVVAYRFPTERIRSALMVRSWRVIAIGCAVTFILADGIFTFGDNRNFGKDISPPQCFADPAVRMALVDVDAKLREIVQPKSGNDGATQSFAIAFPSLVDWVSDRKGQWKAPQDWMEAKAQYYAITKLLLASRDKMATWGDPGRTPRLMNDASVRVWFGSFLTFVGVGCNMAWIWTVFLFRVAPGWSEVAGKKDSFYGAATLSLTLLASWLLLKFYSEWYEKFYASTLTNQGAWLVAMVAACIALVGLWMFRVNIGMLGIGVTTALAGLTFVIGVASKIDSRVVGWIAGQYHGLEMNELLLVHLAIVVGLGGILCAWWQDVSEKPAKGGGNRSQDLRDMD